MHGQQTGWPSKKSVDSGYSIKQELLIGIKLEFSFFASLFLKDQVQLLSIQHHRPEIRLPLNF